MKSKSTPGSRAPALFFAVVVEARSEVESTYLPGQVIAGKYVIESLLGRGAMGVVMRARHAELDEAVALKLLKSTWMDQPEILARFAREARAVVKLRSEHAARVFDVGRTDAGVPFMVMELLEGEDLAAVLLRDSVDVDTAVDWVLEACDALAEAHVNGIVHRDVKPENLFLVQRHGRGRVKLLDFGVSKVALTAGTAQEALHETTTMVGTPLYMSPEQIRRSTDADARADIWSVGCVLYELLTRRPPFLADSLPEVCALILESEPTPVCALRADVDPGLGEVIARCLAKKPADRYACIAELAMALLPYAHRRQHATVEHLTRIQRLAGLTSAHLASVAPDASDRASLALAIPAAPPIPADLVVTRTNAAETETTSPRRRWVPWLALGVAVALGAALAFWAAPRHESARAAPAASPAASDLPTAAASASPSLVAHEPPLASAASTSATPPHAPSPPRARDPVDRTPRKKPIADVPPAVSAPAPTKPPLEIKLER